MTTDTPQTAAYTNPVTGRQEQITDARALGTVEQRTAAARAAQAAFDQRTAFYASARAIEALCPACKQPQSAPSCERREHWGV